MLTRVLSTARCSDSLEAGVAALALEAPAALSAPVVTQAEYVERWSGGHSSGEGESPPASPLPPKSLGRTTSASCVMEIPTPVQSDVQESSRATLVGPSVLPLGTPPASSFVPPPTEQPVQSEPRKLAPGDFTILSLVGQGAFGKVFQVQSKHDGRILAMKVMRKAHVVERNQSEYMRSERDVLTRVEHPYIVLLHFSFQTPTKLYLILDFVNGGHLFFQLYRAGIFDEPLARHYSAELVLALAHLHSLGIAHRGA